jgi:hypothetical protein
MGDETVVSTVSSAQDFERVTADAEGGAGAREDEGTHGLFKWV